jgi:hypothetical protein
LKGRTFSCANSPSVLVIPRRLSAAEEFAFSASRAFYRQGDPVSGWIGCCPMGNDRFFAISLTFPSRWRKRVNCGGAVYDFVRRI